MTATLAACGGGGGGGDGQADGSAPPTDAAATPSAPPNPAPAGSGAQDSGAGDGATTPPLDSAHVPSGSLTTFARAAVDGVNAIRQTARACDPSQPNQISPAVSAVGWNTRLEASAFAHAKDMQANDRIEHIGSDGRTVGDRVSAQGYAWSLVGETLGGGFATLEELLRYWVSSPAHCRVLMTADFAEMGLAAVNGSSGNTFANFWALDMARAR